MVTGTAGWRRAERGCDRRERRAERGYNRRGERGYNLVALIVGITILNILLAAVLPLWSTAIQREKEEELIFRGLQYAEAIRVFQTRFQGRLPTRLEELLEIKPRSIRQLWKDPMTPDGKWALVIQGQPLMNQGEGSNPADPSGFATEDGGVPTGLGPAGKGTVAVGPIRGVYSLSDKESIATFMGQQRYNKWIFTVDLLQGGAVNPGNQVGQFQQQGQAGAGLVQSLRWIGRPMRPFLGPPQGSLPTPNVNPKLPPDQSPGPGKQPRPRRPNDFQ
jgi:type II secretory pathway pseudopilin PulG